MFLQINYVKDADTMMHQHNLPLDYPEFLRAKENAKNASNVRNFAYINIAQSKHKTNFFLFLE